MADTLASKIISKHLVGGEMVPGEEIALRIDHTLTQDATGTMAYLQFEAVGVPNVKTELSVSYVDHNLLQTDFKNADDHIYLKSVAAKYGVHFSRPGNGISHQIHLERFSVPGKTLLGSDSHTPTNGGIGMLAIGAGGLDVALAMAGQPFYMKMPKILGVELTGELQPWVSAKDVILEVLRILRVKGGVGRILEYHGEGVTSLDVPSRAAICNMGTEVGATTSIFPSDVETKKFLDLQGRGTSWSALKADHDSEYDEHVKIDLGSLEPMAAQPSSPDNVAKIKDIEGEKISQVIVGSCANSSLRDLLIAAKMLEGKKVHPDVSFEINPGSKQVLENLVAAGGFLTLLKSGARVHQPGCLGCIGMGQAPATDSVSLRTFPRNFPGRSGTKNDRVYLCSPEVAVASAIAGRISDPKKLGAYPMIRFPEQMIIDDSDLIPPPDDRSGLKIIRGPNIKPLPEMKQMPDSLGGMVLIKAGDNVSTDDIMPAGAEILPLRSNIPLISRYVFSRLDPDFASESLSRGGGFVVGGENYGQGSSREHAALAPRYLGVKGVIAKSFARIHRTNLINFGILPLEFASKDDYDRIEKGDEVSINNVKTHIIRGESMIHAYIKDREVILHLDLSRRQRDILVRGGLLNYVKTLQK